MSLARGSKIESPHVRSTSKNGKIHAVERPAETQSPVSQKSLCGRVTVFADLPLRRYQQGLGAECVACTAKVVEARLQAIKERKALRSKKNQPETEAAVKKVATPSKTKAKAKKAPAKKAARPRKTAAAAASKV